MEKETRVSKEFVEQELNEKEPTPIFLHYTCDAGMLIGHLLGSWVIVHVICT